MTQAMHSNVGMPAEATDVTHHPGYQAYQILHAGFVVAPILAGTDKFLHLLTNWDGYLAPVIGNISPIGVHGFMRMVGVIEIVAGILVAVWRALVDMLW